MTTAVQEAPKKEAKTIRQLIESDEFKGQLSKALPRHLSADRFIRVAITAMMRTPKLAECTQASLFNSMLTLSQLGLEPDGRRAHLIPYANRKTNTFECQLIVDYKGLVELVMRGGDVSNIHADVVCENDVFEYNMGQIVTHKIDFKKPRGKVYAVYAMARYKDSAEPKCEVMTLEEVDAIRARSRASESGPWVTDYNEMAKKTVFRRLSKWLPQSAELAQALEHDGDRIDPTGAIDVPSVDVTPAKAAEVLAKKRETVKESPVESTGNGGNPGDVSNDDIARLSKVAHEDGK